MGVSAADVWRAGGLCAEESTAAWDADNEAIPLGFGRGDTPPADFLELFERNGDRFDDYEYQWFTTHSVLLFHQAVVMTASGEEGPFASAIEVRRFRAPDGTESFQLGDGAAIYPCDAIRGRSADQGDGEQETPAAVAQEEGAAEQESDSSAAEAELPLVAPVPGPDEEVSILALLGSPYVVVPEGELWCSEHMEAELDFDYVVDHGLIAESEAPDDLRAFLEDNGYLEFERYEHRWFFKDRIVLYTRVPWGEDDEYGAEAVSLYRKTAEPWWEAEEAGIIYRCE